jgi:hypothetical protein
LLSHGVSLSGLKNGAYIHYVVARHLAPCSALLSDNGPDSLAVNLQTDFVPIFCRQGKDCLLQSGMAVLSKQKQLVMNYALGYAGAMGGWAPVCGGASVTKY